MSLLDTILEHQALTQAKRHLRRAEELPELAWMMRAPASRAAFKLVLEGKKRAALDELPKAKQFYLEAIELEPRYFRAHSFLAMIHHRLREYEEAFEHWNAALELKPNDIGTNLGKAETLHETDRLIQGTQVIDRLLELYPNHAEIWARRAKFAEHANDIPASLEFWRTANQLEPENSGYALGLARVLIKLEQSSEGKEILYRVKELQPDNLATQIEVGHGLLRLNYSRDAVSHFEDLLRRNPEEVPVLNGLINAVDANFDIENVVSWWKEYLGWNKIKARYQSHDTRRPNSKSGAEKTKLLFVSYKNWNFMQHIIELMNEDEDFEVRTLEFNQEVVTALDYLHADPADNASRLSSHAHKHPLDVELLQWADVVFCEWAVHALVWLTRHLPPDTKLVARLHSFEAYGPWPLLIDWSQVNDLIFVADHIREYLDEVVKLSDFKNLNLHTVTPAHSVSKFKQKKMTKADKTLGMMGYNNENKQPGFALKILRALHQSDPEWKLRLLGRTWDEHKLSRDELYNFREFSRYLEEHQLKDHVTFDEWTYDVAAWFPNISHILSTSHREGTHEAVAQGMSSGAQAVVRKWPLSLQWRGAERRYPNAILFDTPQEAAEKILAQHENFTEEHRAQIIEEAHARFSPDVVVEQVKAIVRGTQ